MLTVSIYFRVKNHAIWCGEDGYMMESMDFNTADNPKGLIEILKLPEMMRTKLVKSLKLEDKDVEVISKLEYEEETVEV